MTKIEKTMNTGYAVIINSPISKEMIRNWYMTKEIAEMQADIKKDAGWHAEVKQWSKLTEAELAAPGH